MKNGITGIALAALLALPTLTFAQSYYAGPTTSYAPYISSGYTIELPPVAQQSIEGAYQLAYQYGGYASYPSSYSSYYPSSYPSLYYPSEYGYSNDPYESSQYGYSYPTYSPSYSSPSTYYAPTSYSPSYEYPQSYASYPSGDGAGVPCSISVGGMCGQDTQIGFGAAWYQGLQ